VLEAEVTTAAQWAQIAARDFSLVSAEFFLSN